MHIINGRVMGDLSGKFTCFSRQHEPSVIDYALVSSDLFPSVGRFSVGSLEWPSIHCPLSLSLNVPFKPSFDNSVKLERFPTYKLDDVSTRRYSHVLVNAPNFQEKAANIVFSTSCGPAGESPESINLDTNSLTEIYIDAAKMAKLPMKNNRKNEVFNKPLTKNRE